VILRSRLGTEATMPTRQDLERLVAWCDGEAPFSWTKKAVGVALAVRSVVPIGTPLPSATALWVGELLLRSPAGTSELPDAPARFVGSLSGVRNPARRAQLTIDARPDRIVARLSGDAIPAVWGDGLEVEHVTADGSLVQADWTFGDTSVGASPPEGFAFPQLFDLAAWPTLHPATPTGPP
jgi:hypothetical protein